MKKLFNNLGRKIIYASLIGFSLFNFNKKEDIFLTGFGDSPYTKNNPTSELMNYFAKEGYNAIVLNADYDGAPLKLNEIYKKLRPKKIISMGVSSHPIYLDVSVVANNMMHASKPDNSGKIYHFEKIDSTFPEKIYLSEENIKKLISNFERENVKFNIDSVASTYVCNSLLFEGINLSKEKGVEFYFFHIPYDIIKDKNKLNNLEKAVESITRN